MEISLETIGAVGQCQIEAMQKRGQELDPSEPLSCEEFLHQVRNVEATIRSTYQLISYVALRQHDPANAAELWKQMYELCDKALIVLKAQKVRFPHCGTPDLYDLALDFKLASDRRYRENLEDSECPQATIPKGLFPKTS